MGKYLVSNYTEIIHIIRNYSFIAAFSKKILCHISQQLMDKEAACHQRPDYPVDSKLHTLQLYVSTSSSVK